MSIVPEIVCASSITSSNSAADCFAAEKDLDPAALRAQKLQPPFYSLLGKHWVEVNEREIRKPEIEATLFYIALALE